MIGACVFLTLLIKIHSKITSKKVIKMGRVIRGKIIIWFTKKTNFCCLAQRKGRSNGVFKTHKTHRVAPAHFRNLDYAEKHG